MNQRGPEGKGQGHRLWMAVGEGVAAERGVVAAEEVSGGE